MALPAVGTPEYQKLVNQGRAAGQQLMDWSIKAGMKANGYFVGREHAKNAFISSLEENQVKLDNSFKENLTGTYTDFSETAGWSPEEWKAFVYAADGMGIQGRDVNTGVATNSSYSNWTDDHQHRNMVYHALLFPNQIMPQEGPIRTFPMAGKPMQNYIRTDADGSKYFVGQWTHFLEALSGPASHSLGTMSDGMRGTRLAFKGDPLKVPDLRTTASRLEFYQENADEIEAHFEKDEVIQKHATPEIQNAFALNLEKIKPENLGMPVENTIYKGKVENGKFVVDQDGTLHGLAQADGSIKYAGMHRPLSDGGRGVQLENGDIRRLPNFNGDYSSLTSSSLNWTKNELGEFPVYFWDGTIDASHMMLFGEGEGKSVIEINGSIDQLMNSMRSVEASQTDANGNVVSFKIYDFNTGHFGDDSIGDFINEGAKVYDYGTEESYFKDLIDGDSAYVAGMVNGQMKITDIRNSNTADVRNVRDDFTIDLGKNESGHTNSSSVKTNGVDATLKQAYQFSGAGFGSWNMDESGTYTKRKGGDGTDWRYYASGDINGWTYSALDNGDSDSNWLWQEDKGWLWSDHAKTGGTYYFSGDLYKATGDARQAWTFAQEDSEGNTQWKRFSNESWNNYEWTNTPSSRSDKSIEKIDIVDVIGKSAEQLMPDGYNVESRRRGNMHMATVTGPDGVEEYFSGTDRDEVLREAAGWAQANSLPKDSGPTIGPNEEVIVGNEEELYEKAQAEAAAAQAEADRLAAEAAAAAQAKADAEAQAEADRLAAEAQAEADAAQAEADRLAAEASAGPQATTTADQSLGQYQYYDFINDKYTGPIVTGEEAKELARQNAVDFQRSRATENPNADLSERALMTVFDNTIGEKWNPFRALRRFMGAEDSIDAQQAYDQYYNELAEFDARKTRASAFLGNAFNRGAPITNPLAGPLEQIQPFLERPFITNSLGQRVRNPDYDPEMSMFYMDAGPDGILGNADDIERSWSPSWRMPFDFKELETGVRSRLKTEGQEYLDLFNKEDENGLTYQDRSNNEKMAKLKELGYTTKNAGPDGIWNTADDGSDSAGLDGILGTADDNVSLFDQMAGKATTWQYGDEDEYGSRANLDRDYLEAKSYYDSEMNKLNLLDSAEKMDRRSQYYDFLASSGTELADVRNQAALDLATVKLQGGTFNPNGEMIQSTSGLNKYRDTGSNDFASFDAAGNNQTYISDPKAFVRSLTGKDFNTTGTKPTQFDPTTNTGNQFFKPPAPVVTGDNTGSTIGDTITALSEKEPITKTETPPSANSAMGQGYRFKPRRGQNGNPITFDLIDQNGNLKGNFGSTQEGSEWIRNNGFGPS